MAPSVWAFGLDAIVAFCIWIRYMFDFILFLCSGQLVYRCCTLLEALSLPVIWFVTWQCLCDHINQIYAWLLSYRWSSFIKNPCKCSSNFFGLLRATNWWNSAYFSMEMSEYATITKIRTALDFHNILFIFSCVDFWFSALFLGSLELLLLRSRDNNWFTWSPWLGSWLLHLLYLSVVIFRHSFHVFVLYSSLVNHLAGMVKYNMVQWHVTSFSDLQILNQISDANG